MTILEMANQLGHMLAETDVMKRSKAAEAAFQSDADLQADIAEYNAQTAAMQKTEDDESKAAIRERADALYGKIISYPTYVAYFEANNAVMKLMNEVNEEINFAIIGEHGCGGNCSSCGGCH